VFPAIASVTAVEPKSGSGATVIEPPDSPSRRSRWPGRRDAAPRPARERAERLAGSAAQLEADRTVELAALERPGQAGAERAIGGRQAEPGAVTECWPRNAPTIPNSSGMPGRARSPGRAGGICRGRAASAAHGTAPMTGASSTLAA
jgi:hypothetical protein